MAAGKNKNTVTCDQQPQGVTTSYNKRLTPTWNVEITPLSHSTTQKIYANPHKFR